uniref:Uncharacterized protein n=1 Tax=Daphnia magna TaxID=35525 RepID=A0A0P6I8R0_9CRUS
MKQHYIFGFGFNCYKMNRQSTATCSSFFCDIYAIHLSPAIIGVLFHNTPLSVKCGKAIIQFLKSVS